MGSQVGLKFNVYVTGGVIHKDTTTTIHGVLVCFASASKQLAFCGANKRIHRRLLAGGQVILL
jgi:hypothetical protein